MNLHDFGATGIIAIVILAFAVIGFLKGLLRTVLAMVCLGIAGYAALWGHEHASDLTAPWISSPGLWTPKIIAIVTGLTVFLICRYLLKSLVNPLDSSKTGKYLTSGLPAAALSLCSGLIILWLAFTGIRYGGSLAELRHTRNQVLKNDFPDIYTTPLLIQARQALDASSAGKWHQLTDPLYVPGKLQLCQILVMYHHAQTREKMLTSPELNPLLNKPGFLELAHHGEIKKNAMSSTPRDLLASPLINEALAKPEFASLLLDIPSSALTSISAQFKQ